MPTSAGSRSAAYLSQDRGPMIDGVVSMLLVLCTFAITARILVRKVTKIGLGADDYLCFIAYFFIVGFSVEYLLFVRYGLGKHEDAISAEPNADADFINFGKVTLAFTLTYGATIYTVKLAVLSLYRRIFHVQITWFTIAWWVAVGMATSYFIAITVYDCLQCYPKPLSNLWSLTTPCGQDYTAGLTFGIINAVIDFGILLLPIRITWSLEMPKRQRLAVISFFLLGSLVVVVSCVRLQAFKGRPTDPTYDEVSGLIWSFCEPTVGLICACLPILRPLFSHRTINFFTGKRSNSSYAPFDIKHGSSKGTNATGVANSSYALQSINVTEHFEIEDAIDIPSRSRSDPWVA